jgi:arginyl-tRNA synthetase
MADSKVPGDTSVPEHPGVPPYPGSYPSVNPVDIFRSLITKALVEITGVAADIVFPALQWQNNLGFGDLVLAVPRLRVKGAKPDELAKKWASEVSL